MSIKIFDYVSIIVSSYDNLQVRTGFYIKSPDNINDLNGHRVEQLNKEDYIIPNLKSEIKFKLFYG